MFFCENKGIELVLEVAQHLGNDIARCVAMSTTDGCRRGMETVDTGNAIRVPVGENTKGRIFNLLGKPLDRDEWFMTPQTINAYYNPGFNEIVFPAAILQFPFFDESRDAAANYGAIGAVIGHEIGHGFDDQGSRFDGDGRLTDWWTAEDRAAFEERTASLIAQYDALALNGIPDHHVNGALTIGENIGDLPPGVELNAPYLLNDLRREHSVSPEGC